VLQARADEVIEETLLANLKSRTGSGFPVDLNQQDERELGYLVTPNRPTNYRWYSGEVL
jgi:hypothetical protein